MKRFLSALLIASISAAILAQAAEEPALECNAGPAHKDFGGVPWFVYACADGATVTIVSAPKSPAMPFYFILQPNGEGIKVYGEGTGPKSATDPAYAQLSKLNAAELAQLHADASAASAPRKQ
jgi:hypothetical protein